MGLMGDMRTIDKNVAPQVRESKPNVILNACEDLNNAIDDLESLVSRLSGEESKKLVEKGAPSLGGQSMNFNHVYSNLPTYVSSAAKRVHELTAFLENMLL